MPFMARRTVIVNLQKTPDDDDENLTLRIFSTADAVMTALMDRLGVAIDPAPTPSPAKLRSAKLPTVRGATPPKSGRGRTSGTGKSTAATPAVPSSAKSMRAHIVATQQRKGTRSPRSMRQVQVEVDAMAVGVSVKGC